MDLHTLFSAVRCTNSFIWQVISFVVKNAVPMTALKECNVVHQAAESTEETEEEGNF